jgi:hypothetical protein
LQLIPAQCAKWLEERPQNARRQMLPKWKFPGYSATVHQWAQVLLLLRMLAGPRLEQLLPLAPVRKFRENSVAKFDLS